MYLEDVLKEFLFDCQLRKLSPRTLKGRKNNNLAFLRYLKSEHQVEKLNEVNYLMIQLYIQFLMDKKLSPVYINSIIKELRAFFKYCTDEDYIKVNPMNKIKFQKEPLALIETFNDQEVLRLVRHFNGKRFLDVRNRLIMIMLFDTGIRNNELCYLKVTDIRDTHINIIGKGNKQRYVPITPILNKALIQYNRVRTPYIKDKVTYETEYLFLSQKGRRLTVEALERIVKDAGIAVGVRQEIRCSPHTCRHYFAQAQLRNGCDIYSLSKLLGHSNINTTKVYLKSMNNDEYINMTIKTSPLMNLL